MDRPSIKRFGTSVAVLRVAFTTNALVRLLEGLGQTTATPILAKVHLSKICRLSDSAGSIPNHWTPDGRRERQHLLYGTASQIPQPSALPPSDVYFDAASAIECRMRHTYSLRFRANVLNLLLGILLRVILV